MWFENNAYKTSDKYFLWTVEIQDYNVMIDGKNLFDPTIKNDQRTYNEIRKIATCQGDDYVTGRLLHYVYFKNYYKMIAIDLKVVSAIFLLVCFSSLNKYLWNVEKMFFISLPNLFPGK